MHCQCRQLILTSRTCGLRIKCCNLTCTISLEPNQERRSTSNALPHSVGEQNHQRRATTPATYSPCAICGLRGLSSVYVTQRASLLRYVDCPLIVCKMHPDSSCPISTIDVRLRHPCLNAFEPYVMLVVHVSSVWNLSVTFRRRGCVSLCHIAATDSLGFQLVSFYVKRY